MMHEIWPGWWVSRTYRIEQCLKRQAAEPLWFPIISTGPYEDYELARAHVAALTRQHPGTKFRLMRQDKTEWEEVTWAVPQ